MEIVRAKFRNVRNLIYFERIMSYLQLILHYKIPEFKTCDEFLTYIARKGGRLKKGGRPDLNAAARKARFKA